jgi:hypothetical protein
MPTTTLKDLPPLDLCRLEDSLHAAAQEFRYVAAQLDRACIAVRGRRWAVAEQAIGNHLDGLARGFEALNGVYDEQ